MAASRWDLIMVELKDALIDATKTDPPVTEVFEGRQLKKRSIDRIAFLESLTQTEHQPGQFGWSAWRFPVRVTIIDYLQENDLEGSAQKDRQERTAQSILNRYAAPHGKNNLFGTGANQIPNLLWTEARVIELDRNAGDLRNADLVMQIDYFLPVAVNSP